MKAIKKIALYLSLVLCCIFALTSCGTHGNKNMTKGQKESYFDGTVCIYNCDNEVLIKYCVKELKQYADGAIVTVVFKEWYEVGISDPTTFEKQGQMVYYVHYIYVYDYPDYVGSAGVEDKFITIQTKFEAPTGGDFDGDIIL